MSHCQKTDDNQADSAATTTAANSAVHSQSNRPVAHSAAVPSPSLQAANKRLLALRAQHAEKLGRPPWETAPGPGPAGTLAGRLEATIAQLPNHLGWHSQAVTQAVRAAMSRHAPEREARAPLRPPAGVDHGRDRSEPPAMASEWPEMAQTVQIQPDVAQAQKGTCGPNMADFAPFGDPGSGLAG